MISCKTNKEGFIEFRHIGECDKYIQSLRIVKIEKPSDIMNKVIKVDEKSFDYLYKYLTNGRKEGKCIDNPHKYGSFKVTVKKDRAIDFCYIIDSRKQSLAFFQGVLEYLKQNDLDENLQKAINTVIIQRIDHIAPGFPEPDPRMQHNK